MNIVVCVKQVPVIEQVKLDPETKTLVREGVDLRTNSLDRRALTQAIKLREEQGGTVTVITMGPPQARAVLDEALALGADRAIHLLDRAFAGSDTLATARTLAAAIKRLTFDLIFCGRFSLDAETGQVGPEVAEFLNIPQVTNLRHLELQADGHTLVAQREVDDGTETLEIEAPCLFTAGEFLITPLPRPTPEAMEAASHLAVETWSTADLELPQERTGQAGSPTVVSEIRELTIHREKRVILGDDPDAAASQLRDYLLARGLYTPWRRAAVTVPSRSALYSPRPDRAVWVVVEQAQGSIRGVTLELLGKGAQLAERLNSEVAAVLIGSDGAADVSRLATHGADRVYVADHPALEHYNTELYTRVLAEAIVRYKPHIVLVPATVNGRDLAPRVAARLGLGLTGDCIDLEIDEEERLVQLKPAFGGTIVAPILSRTSPAMATVRPGMLARLTPQPGREAIIERLPVDPGMRSHVRHVGFQPVHGADGIAIDDAEVVVGVGAGTAGPEKLPLLHELAAAMDGTIAASLRAVSTGLLPGPLQIGLTGRAISPRFYIAVAIRGSLNHMIGVQKAETIVAVNNDPAADIFKVCDFGVVGDFTQIVPPLTRLLRQAKEARLAAIGS